MNRFESTLSLSLDRLARISQQGHLSLIKCFSFLNNRHSDYSFHSVGISWFLSSLSYVHSTSNHLRLIWLIFVISLGFWLVWTSIRVHLILDSGSTYIEKRLVSNGFSLSDSMMFSASSIFLLPFSIHLSTLIPTFPHLCPFLPYSSSPPLLIISLVSLSINPQYFPSPNVNYPISSGGVYK